MIKNQSIRKNRKMQATLPKYTQKNLLKEQKKFTQDGTPLLRAVNTHLT